MGRFVEGASRNQATLLPECLEDFIAEDNPVRIVDAFVDELDLASMASKAPRRRSRADRLTIRPFCSNSTSTAISIACSRADVWSASASVTSN